MSHRIIEKRRRDRMNNCLADLSRLIPQTYLKQGQGRIEKTEIIELATKHIEHLTKLANYSAGDAIDHLKLSTQSGRCCEQKFYMGFKECQDELMRFFVEEEGWDSKHELLSKIMCHLDASSIKFNSESGCMDENGDLQVGKMEKDEIISDDGNSIYSTQSHNGVMLTDSQLAPLQNASLASAESCMSSIQKQSIANQHLRHLLTGTAHNDDSLATSSGSDACITLMSLAGEGANCIRREEGSSFCSSSLPFDRPNLSESEQSNNASGCEKNVYKFKHNITKRFSLEERHNVPGSDTSSSSSHEETNVKIKRRAPRTKPDSPSSDETPYPNSDHSSNENGTGYGSPKGDSCGQKSENSKASISLPAFLLHPSGTHYIPFSVHPCQVKNVVSLETSQSNSMFHPITIPVNFGGNVISMQNINIDSSQIETSLKIT